MTAGATIGMVFECGPQGADKQVCEYLAQQLHPNVRIMSRTMDSKLNFLGNAAVAAKQLLDAGACCVLLIWDLRPAWPDKKSKPCRKVECNQLKQQLELARVPANAFVHLICVEQELESWLLAFHTSVNTFLSKPTRVYNKLQRQRRPDQVADPKAVMMKHFKQAGAEKYSDRVHASRVIKSIAPPNWGLLRQSHSFSRFENKLLIC